MRLLIVRHGDPDYSIDSLTEKGKREAELLADRLVKENIAAAYCSTLGRAKRTAAPTLERLGMQAEECSWLREFDYGRVCVPYLEKDTHCWDLLPSFVAENPLLYSATEWRNVPFVQESPMPNAYDAVCASFDRILAKHGYVRDGVGYRAVSHNHDTLLLVCHYGVASVLLSHLLYCSPYSFWQNTVLLPTSVTTVCTEEREEGKSIFRCIAIGDLSHLYAVGEKPSFAGRFCECFTDSERH